MKIFADSENKTYAEIITYLQDAGIISEEQAEMMTSTLNKAELSPEEQAKVDAVKQANPGMTDAEAMGLLGLDASDESGVQESAYKEINPEEWADQLYDAMNGAGTFESALESIIYDDDNITDEQFAKIVEAYESKYGINATPPGDGLVSRIEKETSGELQKNLTSAIGERLRTAAEDGDETALKMICENLFVGTAGNNGTADDFLAAVFKTDDLEFIYELNKTYSEVNKGRDLVEDIKGDHGGFLNWRNGFGIFNWNANASGNGQSYIDLIEKANRLHQE